MEFPPEDLTHGQLISNWDDIYRGDNQPQWEDLEPNREFLSLIQGYCSSGMRVLEVGSGLGHNALALARMGVDVTASDCSQNAVRRCSEMADHEGVSMQCRVLDIMRLPADVGTYDLVFDKGCWHTFFEDGRRKQYVEQIAGLLPDGGIWINSTGSADTSDSPDDPGAETYPRWKLDEIVRLVDGRFEVLQFRRGHYGYHGERRFLTWEGVFRKRSLK